MSRKPKIGDMVVTLEFDSTTEIPVGAKGRIVRISDNDSSVVVDFGPDYGPRGCEGIPGRWWYIVIGAGKNAQLIDPTVRLPLTVKRKLSL